MSRTVLVVGGGAAGVFAALRARDLNRKLSVRVLEAAAQPLGKVRISGGGRCNVTHQCDDLERLTAAYPRGGVALRPLFERFRPRDTVNWFQTRGVRLKTEDDGRIFPVTDDSQTIIDCLLSQARTLGVPVETRTTVSGVFAESGGFRVETTAGVQRAEAVVLATGGTRRSHPWLTRLGHEVIPPVPSLFTFNLDDEDLRALAGISVPGVVGRLTVENQTIEQSGDLLFTHWGISGPLVLRLSAWGARMLHAANYRGDLSLDLMPQQPALSQVLQQCRREVPRREIGGDPPIPLPRRLWKALVRRSGVPADRFWAGVSNQAIESLAAVVQSLSLRVTGKGVFKEEFVTAGGVSLAEVDLQTMQSRLVPGLYLIGEVLDVDGLTGGFNFQNAWSGGWVAGEAVARL